MAFANGRLLLAFMLVYALRMRLSLLPALRKDACFGPL